ncbi:CobW family GTP-binding protein [Paenibacillus jilunlii]|uniref:Cobalamin biosynthesis protein n=1 Tax=Paenibacillus jilunlii TaxID=682956 RepID=A0A1G9JVZ3_9BACL|nr:GTP-binding protein [Paenibacillus jilunlii]KWX70129.1 cobalamin biosynthesis protein [Paenibacillus jilunlii]SDL41810.1 GTPase, G3E family [Paenibacillus jilunlii]
MEQAMPVYILSGFLGSGKTTLLQRLLDHWKAQGLKPAVVMNELGEVNLDGLLVGQSVPMAEMLGGCICCSIRGDLSTELATLIKKESPDVVVIEATGAANPLEIVDAVTEISLYQLVELKGLITVVDAAHLIELYRSQQGSTYRLMQEQIRCASVLILNKTDRVTPQEAEEITVILRKWNAYAEILPAVRCDLEPEALLEGMGGIHAEACFQADEEMQAAHAGEASEAGAEVHGSHDHVMAYTHYFTRPVNSEEFEQFVKELPRDVYRAKGIVTFSDTSSRFLFQYAYREADFMKITPQGDVPDVAVFIGEHFSSRELRTRLLQLEKRILARPAVVKRSL